MLRALVCGAPTHSVQGWNAWRCLSLGRHLWDQYI